LIWHIVDHLDTMQFHIGCGGLKWIAYFDLLGVRALLEEGKEPRVFEAYDAALRQFQNHSEWAPDLRHAWFSDTFMIVAPDDSEESYERLEYMSRLFAYALLFSRIPLRGAIACSRFYADFDERVFFGSALLKLMNTAKVRTGSVFCCVRVQSSVSTL
jgi:hypothetical protein